MSAAESPVRVAVVGFGYWGPNLARNFATTPEAELAAICDLRPSMLTIASQRFPQAKRTTSYAEILEDPSIDAVVIATPVSTHTELAIAALRADKHVLVSKPLAGTVDEAEQIVNEAEECRKVLLVDHTFVYMGAVQKIAQLVESGEMGKLYYFDSVRVNLGLYQHDVSVLWDLAVHDLSIIGCCVRMDPIAVSCIGVRHVPGHPEDVAYLTVLYPDDFVAHVHVNWLSPVKIRRTLLGGSRKMILFDDLDPVEKIKVYDRGLKLPSPAENAAGPIAYRRTGDVWSPQLDMTEPLKVEASHFVRCIRGEEEPRTNGRQALQIVEILEAAEKSMRSSGQSVPLTSRVYA
jgi:predicted dehydrogenase